LHADAVLINGGEFQPDGVPALRGRLVGHSAHNLSAGAVRSLESFRSAAIHAVAGIGNPKRFFRMLEQAGLQVAARPLADHATIGTAQLTFDDNGAVLMTEKDAVKAAALHVKDNWWFVPVDFVLADADSKLLMGLIEAAIGQPAQPV
jgi:tetraacyldisaccharide 4'-kinase